MLNLSKINLRIQKFSQKKGFSLPEISKISKISTEISQSYTAELVDVTEEICNSLRKISRALDTSVLDLIEPTFKREAFRLGILELCKKKEMSFKELADRLDIHPSILGFYSTQVIDSQKLIEPKYQEDMDKISQVLNCSIEELKSEAELPKVKLQIEDWANERELTLEDLSLLTGLPHEFISLVNTHPINIPSFVENKDVMLPELNEIMIPVRELLCAICKCCSLE